MDLLLAAATDPAAPLSFDWDAFWNMWRVPIRIAAILLIAVLLRVALHFTIRRVVDQVTAAVDVVAGALLEPVTRR